MLRREPLSEHLVRLVLGDVTGPDAFASTGVLDEWVGLVVPGQFQSRYYTVRSWDGVELVLDVVVHEEGLVTEWASRDCVGDRVTLSEPKGSFAMPDDAGWLLLVGDLTAMPAMARILETVTVADPGLGRGARRPARLPARGRRRDLADPAGPGRVRPRRGRRGDRWPDGDGYFWMAGESSQMRAIRKHLMRDVRLPSTAYDVMGYWRGGAQRQPRAVDPGPIWRAGKAAGRSDDEIWAAYDAAREVSS